MALGMRRWNNIFFYYYHVITGLAESQQSLWIKDSQSARSETIRGRGVEVNTNLQCCSVQRSKDTPNLCHSLHSLHLLSFFLTQELRPICSPSYSPAHTARAATSATAHWRSTSGTAMRRPRIPLAARNAAAASFTALCSKGTWRLTRVDGIR